MVNNYILNKKDIKYYVKNFLESKKIDIYGKLVVDIPAGNGVTSEILIALGAYVEAFDLFPEYFTLKNVECKFSDVMVGVSIDDEKADWVICQEGIEHFSDQLKVFQEFNRIIKKGGRLLITTPSYSCLAARLSYLLFESETNKRMPPNEIDDIWLSEKSTKSKIYYGHIFLIGLQKLRTLAKLTGFEIEEIKYVRLSKGSLFAFPFLYPFIFISSYIRYFKNLNKNPSIPISYKKKVYREQLKININIGNLLSRNTLICFKKEVNHDQVNLNVDNVAKPLAIIT